MKQLEVYRGVPFTDTIQAPTLTGYSNARAVWSWRQATRAADWNISKSSPITNGATTLQLTGSEASVLPFTHGFCSVFYVNDYTGDFKPLQDFQVNVRDVAGGGNVFAAFGSYIPLGYAYFGTASIGDKLGGAFTVPSWGQISSINLACQNAPLGGPLAVEIYLDDAPTGVVGTIGAGTTSNIEDVSLEVDAGQILTLRFTSIGAPPHEGADVTASLIYSVM